MEIKFRAWDERNKIMHYNFQWIRSGIEGNDWIVFISDRQTLKSEPHPFQNPYFAQQLKIMQWTGLVDANGKDIYVGDFLTGRANLIVVQYRAPEFEFSYKNPDKGHWLKTMCCGWGDLYQPEVVGNIYENSELINKGI